MTIRETRSAIVEALDALPDVSVAPYRGEISDPKKPSINFHHLPAIFVDYIGDESDGERRTLYFNLYIVHLSFSANETYRDGARGELFDLLEQTDSALRHVSDVTLLPRRSKKIYDDRTPKGYLSIYTRAVEAQITDEGVNEWNLE